MKIITENICVGCGGDGYKGERYKSSMCPCCDGTGKETIDTDVLEQIELENEERQQEKELDEYEELEFKYTP